MAYYNQGDYTAKAVWNMDQEALKRINYYQNLFTFQMQIWDLENAYWSLRMIRMNFSAKMNKKEIESVEKDFKEIDDKRIAFLKKIDGVQLKGEYYKVLEKVYMNLSASMKNHGLYFREGDDPRTAVMR